jgi:D-sedoheptulose 7-phosphate isomerase
MLVPYIKELESVRPADVENVGAAIGKARRVFIMGNGGSASTANHFASDLQNVGILAQSLCANEAVITRLGNDKGFDVVFRKQLEELGLGKPDVVIVISVSGKSQNLIQALVAARVVEAQTIGLLGSDMVMPRDLVTYPLVLQSKLYGVVEGVHACVCHMIVDVVKRLREGGGCS